MFSMNFKFFILLIYLIIFLSGCATRTYTFVSPMFKKASSYQECRDKGMKPVKRYEDGSVLCSTKIPRNEKDVPESYNVPKIKRECATKGNSWYVKIYADGSALCINKEQEEFNKKPYEEKQRIIAQKLERHEKKYLNEYEQIKNNIPKVNVKWVQPLNKKEPCKIYVGYDQQDPTQDESYKLY